MANPPNDLKQGLAAHQAGKLGAARVCYQRVLAAQPRNPDALHLLGTLLAGAGEAERGIELMRKAVAARRPFPAAHYNLGNALIGQGLLTEAEAEFGVAAAQDPAFAEAHCNRGNALVLLHRPLEAEAAFQKAVAARPGYKEARQNLALVRVRQGDRLKAGGRMEEALSAYRAALEADPDRFDALNNLGAVLDEGRRFAEALPVLDRAVRVSPRAAEAHNNRGMALQGLNRLEEAADAFGEAVRIRAEYADAWANLGNARVAANRLDAAFEAYDRALALDPANAMARKNAAMARLLGGDFRRGWTDYEARQDANPPALKRFFGSPQWTGEAPVEGRPILLHAEQGIGDTLQFIRYAPLLAARGAEVTVEVQPPLAALLAAQDFGFRVIARGDPLPPFDLHCPLLSLPRAFSTDAGSIPAPASYLRADPAKAQAWRSRVAGIPGEGLKVGFVWAGNPQHTNDHNRSIPLAAFRRILETGGCRSISLQREASEADRAILPGLGSVTDWTRELADFSDTAALVANLDLVVTVDTSVAHLAAALGKPTWILLPFSPDWRWLLGRPDSPWYPGVRLYRQPATGAWEPVLEAVAADLGAAALTKSQRSAV